MPSDGLPKVCPMTLFLAEPFKYLLRDSGAPPTTSTLTTPPGFPNSASIPRLVAAQAPVELNSSLNKCRRVRFFNISKSNRVYVLVHIIYNILKMHMVQLSDCELYINHSRKRVYLKISEIFSGNMLRVK